LYSAVAIIFVWKGLWEGLYEIPYIGDSFVFLFIGFAMLTFSGLIFKEFDPLGGVEKAIHKTVTTIQKHPDKKNFKLKYHDKSLKKDILIDAERLKKMEKGILIVRHKNRNQEVFIPIHRLTEVTYKGKTSWKL